MSKINREVKKKSKIDLESDNDDELEDRVRNPLKAAKYGHSSLFKLATQDQLDEYNSLRDKTGRSVLHVAADFGETEILEILAKADTEKKVINSRDNRGWAPIHSASNSGYLDVIESLVKYGADIDLTNDCGRTALHYAVMTKRIITTELLIRLGANVNAQDKVGFVPLHRAAGKGLLDICKTLINAGAEIDVLDKTEQTPLVHAVFCEQKETAVYLIKEGAEWFKLDVPDQNQDTILDHAPKDLEGAIWKAVRELGMMYDQPLARPSLYAAPVFKPTPKPPQHTFK